MMLIPVLDLMHGRAVQARAGDRVRYAPVESTLTPGRGGDPVALVAAYRDVLGARECYVADLDAIEGRATRPGLHQELARAATPCALMMDAGIAGAGAALDVLAIGVGRVVVGLETLRRMEDLEAIVAAAGQERVIFGLDLHHGRPILHSANQGRERTALDIAARAVAAGARTLLVIDVGRVGTAGGVDLGLLEALRRGFPSERLLAGGGVADRRDLDRLRDAGCDGVLLATALHSGRIGAAHVLAFAVAASDQSSTSASR
jgi:phosphoribosylformimino-5-aminoimidazole carboxamide ribotide isomerase